MTATGRWPAAMILPVLGLTVALGAACRREVAPAERADAAGGSAPSSARAPVVEVARPTQGSLETDVEAPGTLIADDEAAIAAEAAGPVIAVRIDEGSRVAQGDVLVQIDPTKAELGVRQAEAALAQARAAFEKTKSELARKQSLLDDRTIPPSTYDMFKAQHDGAAAGVEAADSALQLARQRLSDTTVRAPFGGVVGAKRVSVGQHVREGDPLLSLMRLDPLKLQFELPEKYADRVAVGQVARASFAALPGEPFTGVVRTVYPTVAVQSRTIRVEARMANPRYRLKPGFYATVRVPITRLPGALVIPRAAIVRREGADYVFVVKGERAELTRVETGIETADRVEVVSGVGPEDLVVVSGAGLLRPGDAVQVKG